MPDAITDPTAAIAQLQAQQALTSDALYAITRWVVSHSDVDEAAAMEDAMRFVNALNPEKYVYPPKTDPARPTRLVRAIDVSSSQSTDVAPLLRQFAAEMVVVKLALPEEFAGLQDHALAQLASAKAAGAIVAGYFWGYRSQDPRKSVRDAVALAGRAGVTLPCLWADLEIYRSEDFDDDGPDAAWLRAAVDEADRFGQPIGLYTGRWWVDGYFPGGEAAFAEFNGLPLWLADYDNVPDLGVWQPFSGFTRLHGKQYWDKPIDLDVFSSDVCGV